MATRADPPTHYEDLTSTDRRKVLLALQQRIAEALDDAQPAAVAPLAKQMADVVRELEAMPAGQASGVDDIAAAAARRRERAAAEAMGAQ